MNQNESLLDIIALLYRWRKYILGISFLAALITAGLSLMLSNYYQASTLFYAASPDLVKPTPIGTQNEKKFIYGSAEDLDRIFSIANSNEVTSFLADTFKLYDHYEINKDDKKAKHKLSLKLNKLYTTKKTKYDAIQLSVEDHDPEFSAVMANVARERIDALSQEIIKSSQRKQIEAFSKAIRTKEQEYTQIQDSLSNTRKKYNIFNTASQGEAFGSSMVGLEGKYQNYTAQVEYLTKTGAPSDSILIMKSKKVGVSRQLEKLNSDITNYNMGYETIVTLEKRLADFGYQLNIDKQRLAQLESVYNSTIPSIHLIEKAEVPVFKSRPKRSFLVIGVAFLTFVLMSLWVIIKEQYNKNNWQEYFKDA